MKKKANEDLKQRMVGPTFKIVKADCSVMWTPHPLGLSAGFVIEEP